MVVDIALAIGQGGCIRVPAGVSNDSGERLLLRALVLSLWIFLQGPRRIGAEVIPPEHPEVHLEQALWDARKNGVQNPTAF